MSIVSKLCQFRGNVINGLFFMKYKPVYQVKPVIRGRIHMCSDKGAISFGQGVRINSSLRSNPIGGSTQTILFARPGAKISIGNNCGISNSAIFSQSSITIEDDVMIGGNCKIYDTDFHSLNYEERMSKPDPGVRTKPVVIKKGAFIGAHTIVLKGVTIGEYSVIGAGSVVTKDVPDHEIWAGNPARFLKKVES